ncbi:ABC transporter substrate-binding protein [Marinivivus vitaminiproducens]|uniref:ABC transporter substrate-binding protein n=1 Tax=Marinivivus vitaminiproducens TaxID=3035935 RepID=UPI00279DBD3B|nr:ABC transporter substrate-binding protein [Geminicoccaceae bacterium SCSIO 64248]
MSILATRSVHKHASKAVLLALALGGAAGSAQAFEQAPTLDAAVAAGELPAVDERLPANPLVVEPVDRPGTYGGVWRSGLRGGDDTGWLMRTVGYEPLVRYDRNWEEVVPNLAESFESNADATAFTFHLREGVRWSDGEPFTAEDVAFSLELSADESFPASVPNWMRSVDNPATAEVVDPTTLIIRFEKPMGLFLEQIASVDGVQLVQYQKKHCSQFYQKYNPDADRLAKDNGFQSWAFMLLDRCGLANEITRWSRDDIPSLTAWRVVEPYAGNASHVVLRRNPYYFKVDPAGHQLPYIDELRMRISESVDELTLMALNGEIDYQDRHLTTIINKPLFFDGQEDGGYHLVDNLLSSMNTMTLQLNHNHADPVLRGLFQDKNFRIGLSHAINRQEIIDVVFTSQGEPFQAAPRPESRFYDEVMAKQYTEYDPGKAAEYLAEAGLTEKGGDGILLRPDGKRLSFTIETIAAFYPEWPDMLQLIQLQLREVGIDIQIRTIDRTLYYDKRESNDFDAQVWQGEGGLDVVTEPRYYMPFDPESVFAYKWQAWFNNPASKLAEEPADWAKRQMELYRQIEATADRDEQDGLMRQILAIARDEFPVIGISLPPNGYAVVRNNLHNVASSMKHAWAFPTPAPYDPAQWFFD